MLTSLLVKQFALIEQIYLEFKPGMTVFTGETGAGKSMLVDALGAVFGARARTDWVRHGADRAEVVATLECSEASLLQLLAEQDIACEDELILRRTVAADGRSRAFINGVPVSLKVLQQFGLCSLDLHGQHEHQMLMRPAFQQQLLDAALDASLFDAVASAFDGWREANTRLERLHGDQGEAAEQAEWMRSELVRLDALEIEEGLAEALEQEVARGRHYAQIQQAAAEAVALVDDAEPSARQLIAHAAHAVDGLSAYHERLHSASDILNQIDMLLGEASSDLHAVLDDAFDDRQLRQSEDRLSELHDAMRRHGCDEAGLLALLDQWRERLSLLDTASWDEEALRRQLSDAESTYRAAAGALSQARKVQGEQLAASLRTHLDQLALAGMQVRFQLRQGEWRRDGVDAVVMQVMSNPGEPWRDLAAVASGGELSRLVLALKGGGKVAQMPGIAVFDEVDTGIGGETAWCVGELLARMADLRQLLVISHLPQVASCADHQVVISKQIKEDRTLTELTELGRDERIDELARMLGGGDADARQHAGVMLARGDAVRNR